MTTTPMRTARTTSSSGDDGSSGSLPAGAAAPRAASAGTVAGSAFGRASRRASRRAPGPGRRRPRRSAAGGRQTLAYLLILPTLLALIALIGWPMVDNVIVSLRRITLRELISGEVVWVGLDNYRAVTSDPDFWAATVRTVLFTAACAGVTMVIGTLLALLLNGLGKALRIFLSVCLVLAWATPVLAATTVFQWLFDSTYGVVNWVLVQLGWSSMAGHSWFSTGLSTFFVIGLLIVWQAVPFVAFSLYAGLTTIPGELMEAASMDGATAWRRFSSITLPLLRPLFGVLAFLQVIWDFKAFTQIYAFRQGGPDGSTTTLPVLIYLQGIASGQFGPAAAASVLTVLMLVVLLALYIRSAVRQEEI